MFYQLMATSRAERDTLLPNPLSDAIDRALDVEGDATLAPGAEPAEEPEED